MPRNKFVWKINMWSGSLNSRNSWQNVLMKNYHLLIGECRVCRGTFGGILISRPAPSGGTPRWRRRSCRDDPPPSGKRSRPPALCGDTPPPSTMTSIKVSTKFLKKKYFKKHFILINCSPLDHDPAISGGGAQPGMELVPAWLKLLRLHKYSDLLI